MSASNRIQVIVATVLVCVLGGAAHSAHAADDDNVTRVKEMLRRTQEALRQAQAENAALTSSKTEAEQKLQGASKQLDDEKGSSRTALASLQTQLQAAQSAQAQLQQQLADRTARLSDTSEKLNDSARQLSTKTSEAADLRQSLEQSKNQNTSCEAKNVALYEYATDALKLYRNKGMWAAMSQKEPVLGLGNVQVQNVVQEYQLKIDGQRVKP